MKVICIDSVKVGQKGPEGNIACSCDEIYEGEVYTVINTRIIEYVLYYHLEERRYFSVYNSKRFMPVSDIDETELINEKEEYLV